MYTRSLYETHDLIRQGEILAEIARLIDSGVIRSTVKHRLGRINAGNLKVAHSIIEKGNTVGKIVLSDF